MKQSQFIWHPDRTQEEPALLGASAGSRSGLRHRQKEPVTSHWMRKDGMSEGHRSQLEGTPLGQKWTLLAPGDANLWPCQSLLVPPRFLREITPIWSCPAGLPRACFPELRCCLWPFFPWKPGGLGAGAGSRWSGSLSP